MVVWNNLFSAIDDEQLTNIQNRIFPFHKLIIYFTILQVLFGIINLFYLFNQALGLLEIFFFACFGILTVYIQIPIFYALYSVISIYGCFAHYNHTNFLDITFSDLVSIIFICGIINNFCCSILSLNIFLIITNSVNWESKFESICGNLHIAYIGYPRFNNSASNVGHYTPLEQDIHIRNPKYVSSDHYDH